MDRDPRATSGLRSRNLKGPGLSWALNYAPGPRRHWQARRSSPSQSVMPVPLPWAALGEKQLIMI